MGFCVARRVLHSTRNVFCLRHTTCGTRGTPVSLRRRTRPSSDGNGAVRHLARSQYLSAHTFRRAPRSSARLRALAVVVIVGDVRKRRFRVRGKMSLGCSMLQHIAPRGCGFGWTCLVLVSDAKQERFGAIGCQLLNAEACHSPVWVACGISHAACCSCQMRNKSCRSSISFKSSRMVATQHTRLNECSAVSCDHPCAALRARQAFACAADV